MTDATTPDQAAALDDGIRAWMARDGELQAEIRPREPGLPFTETRERASRLSDSIASETALPVADDATISEIAVTGVDGATFARIYRPTRLEGTAPTQLFLHGGGFVHGGARELVNDSVLSHRAADTGVQIVSLEYALAPEHPYPAARDETIAVLAQLRERADELGIDPSRLGLGGNSAGASIAASAALEIGDGGVRPHHLALEVPMVSLGTLRDMPADSPEATALAIITRAYLPNGSHGAFIADEPDVSQLPPTLIVVAEHDELRAGGELLASRLDEAGVDVTLHVMPGHVHGSPGVTATSQSARDWQTTVADALRTAYGAA